MKEKDEDGITIVNSARTQMTYADYILAEEEYARKKALVAEARRNAGGDTSKRTTASSIAARLDQEQHIRQMKKMLSDPTLKADERNSIERKLEAEEMAHAFSPRD